MENIFNLSYPMGHETLWKPKAAGGAAPASRPVDEEIEKSAGRVQEDGLFREFGF